MNKLIVISGCSSGGKSVLLEELRKQGYTIFPEVGREICRQSLQDGGKITPWHNPTGFCEAVIQGSIDVYNQAQKIESALDNIVFLDRSVLDSISSHHLLNRIDPNKYDHLINQLRYYPLVFMTPPWEEIYTHDPERHHSLEDAIAEYSRLLEFYPKAGYKLALIPKACLEDRIKFILDTIKQNQIN